MQVSKTYKISVDLDGELVVCTNGHVSGGTPSQRVTMNAGVMTKSPVQVVPPLGQFVVPTFNDDDPIGNFAAIVSASDRWHILQVPGTVEEFLAAQVALGEYTPDGGGLELSLGALDV